MKNIVSLVLLVVSVTLSFKHAWDTIHYQSNPQSVKMMADFGIGKGAIPALTCLTAATGILLLFPKTFFWGNVLQAMSVVLIMCWALRAGNASLLVMEIPFLLIPLAMIWLKYPFKN